MRHKTHRWGVQIFALGLFSLSAIFIQHEIFAYFVRRSKILEEFDRFINMSGAALVVVGASLMVFRFSQGTSNARPLVMIVVGLGLLANGMLTAYSGVGGQAD